MEDNFNPPPAPQGSEWKINCRKAGAFFHRTLAVSSGKGGVGKSNFVASFSSALAIAGYKVLVLDGDLGMANLDVLFDIQTEKNLYHFFKGECTLEQILFQIPGGPDVIPGGNGFSELSLLEGEKLNRLLKEIESIQGRYHFFIIDTGAGIGKQVLALCQSADETLLISTPEFPSLANAYGLIKVLNHQNPEVLLKVVANRVEDEAEGMEVFSKLSGISERFLRKKLHFLGGIPEDSQVYQAVKIQTPYFIKFPESRASRAIPIIVKAFLSSHNLWGQGKGPLKVEKNVETFIEKLARNLNLGKG